MACFEKNAGGNSTPPASSFSTSRYNVTCPSRVGTCARRLSLEYSQAIPASDNKPAAQRPPARWPGLASLNLSSETLHGSIQRTHRRADARYERGIIRAAAAEHDGIRRGRQMKFVIPRNGLRGEFRERGDNVLLRTFVRFSATAAGPCARILRQTFPGPCSLAVAS